MRRRYGAALAALALLGGGARADEKLAAEVAEQKKAAAENWSQAEAGPFAQVETDHFLVYVPRDLEKKLPDLAAALEKYYEQANKALKFAADEKLWPGKLTVYVFPDRTHYAGFVRRVEKRRPEPDEAGAARLDGDRPHVLAGPPRSKADPDAERQACQQAAAALLARKAGVTVPLPDWLLAGFGRATHYRVAGDKDRAVAAERARATRLVRTRTVRDVWGGALEAEDANALRASLADYLAYGPGAAKLGALLSGFRPEANVVSKTTEQALTSAELPLEKLDADWRKWALRPR